MQDRFDLITPTQQNSQYINGFDWISTHTYIRTKGVGPITSVGLLLLKTWAQKDSREKHSNKELKHKIKAINAFLIFNV
jgi:hypothetical protein